MTDDSDDSKISPLELNLDSPPMALAKLAVLEQHMSLLTRDSKFQDFAREILLSIMNVVKCEAGSIIEVDYERELYFFRAVVGKSADAIAQFQIPFGQGIVGHVSESKQPLVVDNVDENQIHLKTLDSAIGFETRNMVALPILIRGRVYGVLELLNRVGETTFTPADTELLVYLCDTAAKAIEIRMMLGWTTQKKKSREAA